MSSVTIADAWFVGPLGTAALASLALVFPFQTLMQMMAGGSVGGGTTSAVARAAGAGDMTKASAVSWPATVIATGMALLFMGLFGLFSRQMFTMLGGEGAALEGAVLYAGIAFGGALTTWFLYVLSAVLRGTGDTVTPARAMIACCVVQVPLSGALTLGWGPVPSLAIAGPATAMILCHGTAAAYLALLLLRERVGITLKPQRLAWTPFADIMQVAGVGFFNSATIALTVVAVTGIVGRYGTEALAGYGLGIPAQYINTRFEQRPRRHFQPPGRSAAVEERVIGRAIHQDPRHEPRTSKFDQQQWVGDCCQGIETAGCNRRMQCQIVLCYSYHPPFWSDLDRVRRSKPF